MYRETEHNMFSALPYREVEQKAALKSLFKELRCFTDKLVQKYDAKNKKEELLCSMEISGIRSLVVSEALFWNKVILRRMRKTPRQGCPYRIDISHRLNKEIFENLHAMLTCVSEYGLDTVVGKSRNSTTINIWHFRKLELFFKDILDERYVSFEKNVQGCCLKLLVNNEKLFTIKYNYTLEKLELSCFYGKWNIHHVPQHL